MPKSPLVKDVSATPRDQLNWTDPIAMRSKAPSRILFHFQDGNNFDIGTGEHWTGPTC